VAIHIDTFPFLEQPVECPPAFSVILNKIVWIQRQKFLPEVRMVVLELQVKKVMENRILIAFRPVHQKKIGISAFIGPNDMMRNQITVNLREKKQGF